VKKLYILLFLLVIQYESIGQINRLSEVTIHSPSIQENLLGDPAERFVSVYLPPSYFSDKKRKYPVVYVLHGNRVQAKSRNILKISNEPILGLMDSLIIEGSIREMILVQPDGRNFYGGCQYANSPVSGNWADFITTELVDYIENNYRTLSTPDSRGLVGSSMGGRGVLDIALKYPGIFGVVYAMFPGQMGFQKFPRSRDAESWRKLILLKDPKTTSGSLRRLLGFSVAFSPNPNSPPYYADFPMKIKGESMEINTEVMQLWAQFDPVEIAAKNAEPLLKLNALYFDCGSSDRGLEAVRLFSSILSKKKIPHIFEEYEGGHGDPGAKRMKSRVLPVFSKQLKFE
jgi:enterochelin esterase-like enzyme